MRGLHSEAVPNTLYEGGTLAHAFFPIYGGDVHFDDDENWTDNFQSGTNLLMTASHELGHSLGLAHSNVRGSVMSPFYTPFKNGLRLHKDDVRAIQALYGAGGDSNRSVSSQQSNFAMNPLFQHCNTDGDGFQANF